ncbi:MAG: pentapeptide repeat-containing protein [Pseudanabaenaceae cyanobacterium]
MVKFWILLGAMLWTIWLSPAYAEKYDKEVLAGADFSGKVLIGSQFNKTDLHNANFSNANLQGVSLFGANMTGANFTGANLSYSTLDTARMNNVNLTNAILEGAFAYGTSFEGAIIDGADFTGVDLRPTVVKKLCRTAKGINPVTKRATRETLGCE